MSGTTPWAAQSNVEPVAAVTIEALANLGTFATFSGCSASYSGANMQKTIAAGTVLHTNAVTTVAGNTVTLVSDPTNPRWTYTYINSSGVASIVSGSPAATPAVPDPGANPTNGLDYVQANLTVASNATYKLDKRVQSPSGLQYGGLQQRYKTSVQTFSTNTSFADVAGVGGGGSAFSFAIAANEVWEVEYLIQLSWTGTGGIKFQLTGPSAPTAVTVLTMMPIAGVDSANGALTSPASPTSSVYTFDAAATAFSTSFGARNSLVAASGTTVNTYENTSAAQGAFVRIVAQIQNGANAGTVTLQAAQNSSNATTTLGISSRMRAFRLA